MMQGGQVVAGRKGRGKIRWSGKVVEEENLDDSEQVKVFNSDEAEKAVADISSCPVSKRGGRLP